MSEWNYNLEEAPLGQDVLVTWVEKSRDGLFTDEYHRAIAFWQGSDWYEKSGSELFALDRVIAWMPLPDHAAMPEVAA